MAYNNASELLHVPDPRGTGNGQDLSAQHPALQGSAYAVSQPGMPGQYGQAEAWQDNSADLASLLAILRRRSILILATILIGTGLVAFLSYSLTPVYTSSAEVLLEAPKSNVINVESVLQDETQEASGIIETKINLIESRSFAQRIIQDLNLQNDPEFNPALTTGQTVIGTADGDDLAAKRNDLELVIEEWQKGLEVTQSGSSFVVEIDFTSISPEKSALIANRIAKSYVDHQLSVQRQATTHAANWLSNRIEDLRSKLIDSEQAIEDYRRDNKVFNAQGAADQRLASLNQQLIAVQSEYTGKLAELRQLRGRFSGDQGSIESIANAVQSPIIAALRQSEVDLLRQRAQLAEEFGPNHPKQIQIQLELDNITEKVRVEVGHIIESIENTIQLIGVREDKIKDDIAAAQELSLESNSVGVQLAFLERDVEANRQLYTSFLSRYKELGEQEDLLESNASIISSAAIPTEPSFPKPKLMIVAGFVGSMLVGSVLAVLVDMLDRGLKSARQIEKLFGIPTFGMLPKISLPRRGMQVHQYLLEKPNSAYAEALSAIEVALRIASDGNTKVILVTSALPDEGKTTLAYSLATSLARSKQTVLVDLDLRNPSLVKHMSTAPSKIGLADVLLHRAVIGDVVQQDVDSSNLDVMANAAPVPNATALVSSPVLGAMIDELRRDYEYVVLDSAPLIGIVDSSLIAPLADVALLAVQWSKTKDDAVESALRTLRSSKVESIGAVMTQVSMRKMQRLHYGDAASKYHKRYSKYYQN